MPRSTQAKHNPVIQSNVVNTADQEIAQGQARLLKSTGSAKDALEPSVIVKAEEQPFDDEKTQMLVFMNEPITVRIATSTDKNAEQVFELNINGKNYFFRRGEDKTVPRFVVDRLLRLKETGYTQKEVFNNGVKEYLHIPTTALKYDFAILRDDNPLGSSWQRAVRAEAG